MPRFPRREISEGEAIDDFTTAMEDAVRDHRRASNERERQFQKFFTDSRAEIAKKSRYAELMELRDSRPSLGERSMSAVSKAAMDAFLDFKQGAKEIPGAVPSGIYDAFYETARNIGSAFGARESVESFLPAPPAAEQTETGRIAREGARFATAAMPWMKAAQAVSLPMKLAAPVAVKMESKISRNQDKPQRGSSGDEFTAALEGEHQRAVSSMPDFLRIDPRAEGSISRAVFGAAKSVRDEMKVNQFFRDADEIGRLALLGVEPPQGWPYDRLKKYGLKPEQVGLGKRDD